MKPSQIAKELGLKSLKEMADYLDMGPASLSQTYKNNPRKFEVMAMGVAEHKRVYADTEFIYIGGVKYRLGTKNGKLAVAKAES